jgi:hypothetical protein
MWWDMNTPRHQAINCAQSLKSFNGQLKLAKSEDIEDTLRKTIIRMDHSNEPEGQRSASTASHSL